MAIILSKGEILLDSYAKNQIEEAVTKSNSFRAILRSLGLPRTLSNRMILLKKMIVLEASTEHFTRDGKNIEELKIYLDNLRKERRVRTASNSKKARKSSDFWIRARFICGDAKKSDKNQNRTFDLDRRYIADLIKDGSLYCG